MPRPSPEALTAHATQQTRDENAKHDADLVARAQRGDEDAYRELVERHQRRAFAVAFGVVRNPDDARDVVQDALIKAYRNLDRFKGQSSFYTWLYRIVMNVAIDHVRRQRRIQASYDDGLAHDEVEGGENILPQRLEANPAKNVGRRELVEQMDGALDKLSSIHRSVLLMREVEGMSYTEMAKAMRCSKGTIMSRLFHARKRMQRLMLEYLGTRDLRTFE